jgi:hypothetical protein
MPFEAPKIDPRTYDDVVGRLAELAEELTVQDVAPTSEALTGRILYRPIVAPDGGEEVPPGGPVGPGGPGGPVGPGGPGGGEVAAAGRAEAIPTDGGGIVAPSAPVIADAGTLLDPALAGQLSLTPGLALVSVIGWRPRDDGQPDAGLALIRVFGRLVQLVIERLNRVPEKSFLAFLELIGTRPRPPRPARAPLTFRLAPASPVDGLVPAGTRVAAPPAEGEREEVVFETERDLVVTVAQLTSVLVHEPDADRYGDYSHLSTGAADLVVPAFAGDRPVEHDLYVAHDGFFRLPGDKQATLAIESPDASRLMPLPLVWAYWDGTTWQPLQVTSSLPASNRWQVDIASLPAPTPCSIGGIEAGWLRARLDVPLPGGELTVVDQGQALARLRRRGLALDTVVVGQSVQAPGTAFYPFGNTGSSGTFCYLSADEAFARPGATVELAVTLADAGAASTDLMLTWRFLVAHDTWQELGRSSRASPSAGVTTFAFSDETRALTQNGTIRFSVPATWPPDTLSGRTGRWLRVEISAGNYGVGAALRPPLVRAITIGYTWDLPRIQRITASVRAQPPSRRPPDRAFANGMPIDLGRDFYPFGERPRFNDALFLASQEVVTKPGAQVTIDVTLANPRTPAATPPPPAPPPPPPVQPSSDLQVAWEGWNGQRWQVIGISTPSDARTADSPATFDDRSFAFTASGPLTFTLPAWISPGTVNGEAGAWLRARIVKGSFGDPLGPPAAVVPPIVASLRLGYVYQPSGAPTACLTYNAFGYADQTAAAADTIAMFVPFTPHAPPLRAITTDPRPALYLGFDRRLPNRPISLYARAEPQPYDAAAGSGSAGQPARVTWEYAGPEGWAALALDDETRAFAERGLISFVGPPDLTPRVELGRERAWLRARREPGAGRTPLLRRLLTNTTWASETTTARDEVLGSGDGSPNQVFRTTRAPVLEGERIEVRELPTGGPGPELWVPWQPVPDFYASGPLDRHYVLDHLAGEIRFGDGQHGMVPPRGRDNVRAALYRTGGGARGNRPAGTIAQLKTTVPYVAGVANEEAAAGGAEQESPAALQERGPRELRHGDRAATAQDFEDLALEASSEVAQARALTPQFDPLALEWLAPAATTPPASHAAIQAGRVGLIIVPRSSDPRPVPSLSLIQRVREFVLARCTPTLDLWIAGPDWLEIRVTARVVPDSLEAADSLRAAVEAALTRFLHPLSGGVDGGGWAFGRRAQPSDLYALIESVEGVDYVRSLSLEAQPLGELRSDRFLIFSGEHTISLVSPTGGA